MCGINVTNNVAFKSLVPTITTQEDIEDTVGEALLYQYMFDKRTSPWEMAEWPEGQLKDFKIEGKAVERVYFISHFDDGVSNREFELVVRVIYREKPVYAKLVAGCDFTGFDCQGGGEIYVSLDAQIFLKSVVEYNYSPHDIWASMVDDGLKVEEPSNFDLLPMRAWHNVPMLKFLCHMKIYDEREKLRESAALNLPKVLADSVEDFLKVRETRDHHDDGE